MNAVIVLCGSFYLSNHSKCKSNKWTLTRASKEAEFNGDSNEPIGGVIGLVWELPAAEIVPLS